MAISGTGTLAVIPCLNEAGAVARVIQGVHCHLTHILVVDDGSGDKTAEIAAAAGARVLRHQHRQGKGAALRDGTTWAGRQGFEWVLLMDGDGQHDPADIPTFLEAGGTADLIIGNRMNDCSSMPPLRRWANRWVSRQVSRRLGMEIPDAQCGFRLVRVSAWRAADLQGVGYEIETEMLVKFWAAGFQISAVPVRTIYGSEQSKFHPVRDAWKWWRAWGQMTRSLRRRFRGRP